MKIIGKKREKVIDKDFFEISVSELISVTGGIIAGIFLLGLIDKLSLIPGLLILLPGFLEMHGNISGSLTGRLVSEKSESTISTSTLAQRPYERERGCLWIKKRRALVRARLDFCTLCGPQPFLE